MDPPTRRVRATPKPGFVVKTTTAAPGYYAPASAAARVPVPPALKVFVNVAYAAAVPAPPTSGVLPPADEDAARARAMAGDARSPYVVPVIVSDGRGDVDKAGKPSLVFDALLSPALKPRMTTDAAFRAFVLEIILAHIEAPPHAPGAVPPRALALSRTLTTPNIRSKGPLAPRDVAVPDFAAPEEPPPPPPQRPLIEELPAPAPKSILKKPPAADPPAPAPDPHAATAADAQRVAPAWHPGDAGARIVVDLPDLTRAEHAAAALLLSPDLLTLRTPRHFLQVPLAPAADVARARAEWRVREGRLVVYA